MKNLTVLCAAVSVAAGAGLADGALPLVEPEVIGERLRNRIEAAAEMAETAELVACGDLVYCSCALPSFYERRSFRPAWFGEDGPLPRVYELLDAVRDADREGLIPEDYHPVAIVEALADFKSETNIESLAGMLVDLELLLTDSFLIYGAHLLAGRTDPEKVDPEWHAQRDDTDMAAVLQEAVEKDRVGKALRELLPQDIRYERLREALTFYRDLSARGGWPEVGGTTKLEKGSRGEEVASLRARLIATGDLEPSSNLGGAEFDEDLVRAVLRFQHRHGLAPDAVVGPATREALNTSVEERIALISANLERCRWLPRDPGRRHLLINIARFEMDVLEDNGSVMNMKVIVGKQYRRTPVFSDDMTYLVLSPRWHVPPNIVKKDVLPEIRKDIEYLASKRMKVYSGWGSDAEEIDPRTVDWPSLGDGILKYRFTQDPGPDNSLGRIKFMFPNKFHVYLHDTPSTDLFNRTERAYSSGCIRVERPIELAEYLLRDSPDWSREKILEAIEKWEEKTVRLPEPVPVHLLYWTAWVDEDGTVNFRKDIYGRDRRLERALRMPAPRPGGRGSWSTH
jgi:murein L,D-transpeptidase YcbB/YkuD